MHNVKHASRPDQEAGERRPPEREVTPEQGDLAAAAGHEWAEEKAEALEGAIRAVDWPETWQAAWGGALPFDAPLDVRATETLLAIANHAASLRWQSLLEARRMAEAAGEEEQDLEANAVRLFEGVRDTLPDGLTAVRDGERVYLLDANGMERTITSPEQTFGVVKEWKESRTL